jgi:hypothetical protein
LVLNRTSAHDPIKAIIFEFLAMLRPILHRYQSLERSSMLQAPSQFCAIMRHFWRMIDCGLGRPATTIKDDAHQALNLLESAGSPKRTNQDFRRPATVATHHLH